MARVELIVELLGLAQRADARRRRRVLLMIVLLILLVAMCAEL